MTQEKAEIARTMLVSGTGILKIAKSLRVGTAAIQKIRDQLRADHELTYE